MLSPEQFFVTTGYFAIATLVFGVFTALAFLLKWSTRFRLVGATGFMGVLTVGLFGLSFQPLTRTPVAGAIPYTTVFDSGASQIVITVPNEITETELDATLRQAASNLLKPSRIGGSGQAKPIIRARAIAHESGTSELLYVGSVTAGTGRTDEAKTPVVNIDADALAKANRVAS